MTPKMGRPPVENPKNVSLGIRIKAETADKLQKCASILSRRENRKVSRTEVIEKGIDMVAEEVMK